VRWLGVVYGVVAYVAFAAVFLLYLDFLANAGVVRGIDEGGATPTTVGLAIDLGLVALFGASHSMMARPAFKRWWTRFVPAPLERSTYVLVSSAVLALTAWQWRPHPMLLWNVAHPALRTVVWTIGWAGVGIVVVSTFLIDHFDFLGLRQVWLDARGRPYEPPPFRERGFYRYVRHPLMVGFLIWFWVAPTMSLGRLVFVAGMTVYIAVGVFLEERDLARSHGETYQNYQRRVRAFIPLRR
jgi:protein-S-isoprenylcysteine O-methyltransferase Ste14